MKNPTPLYIGSGILIVIGTICAICLSFTMLLSLFVPSTPSESQPNPRIVRRPTLVPIVPAQVAPTPPPPAEPVVPPPQENQPVPEGIPQTVEPNQEVPEGGGEEGFGEEESLPEGSGASEPLPEGEEASPPDDSTIPIEEARLVITRVDPASEYVDIKNIGNTPQDLTGWRLVSETGGEECPLGGVVEGNGTLRVWTLIYDSEQGGYNCDYSEGIWSDEGADSAVLYDGNGEMIYRR
jgi:hypothetical protein